MRLFAFLQYALITYLRSSGCRRSVGSWSDSWNQRAIGRPLRQARATLLWARWYVDCFLKPVTCSDRLLLTEGTADMMDWAACTFF